MKPLRFTAIIPARYASTRFPGKPLAMLGGKSIIRHVYERVAAVIESTYVATDDLRIQKAVEDFGGRVVMTSPQHRSGTDRCREAILRIGEQPDVVINVQGDEPFITASQLETICRCFDSPETEIATLVKPFTPDMGIEALKDPDTPKVVLGANGTALYFSRSVIPYLRGIDEIEWMTHHTYYKHIGLYAYRTPILARITALPQGELELCESLEQLRWIEAGYTIHVGHTQTETIGIDTPEDLKKAEIFLNTQS